jgi:hypothetical protein
MKTILALTTIGVLTSTASAGGPRPTPTKKPAVSATTKKLEATLKQLDYGQSYVLGARRAVEVTADTEKVEAKSISESAVSKVIKDRVDELEYCWLRLPAAKRVASSAVIHFAIEASGTVAGVDIEGTLPAGVGKCITAAASKWTFPSADSGCEAEHAISLGTKSDVVH